MDNQSAEIKPPEAFTPPSMAEIFRQQSEVQALMGLKATVVSIMLMDQPSLPFVVQVMELTQKLLNHLVPPTGGGGSHATE